MADVLQFPPRPDPTAAEETPVWGSPDPVDVEAGALPEGATDEQPVETTEVVVPSLEERVETGEDDGPLLPAWLTDRDVALQTLKRNGRLAGLAALRWARRGPRVAIRVAWWTLRGAVILGGQVLRWAWDVDGHPRYGATPATDDRAYVRMAADHALRQKGRFTVLAVALVALLIACGAAGTLWPGWFRLGGTATAAGVVALLARRGRPEGVRLVAPVPSVAYRPRLTHQAVVAALMAIGNTALAKGLLADSTRIWRSDFIPVRGGHRIELQLPSPTLASELVQHEQRIAQALARPADTVVVEPLPQRTPGDLRLWVFDKPVLAGDRGPGPLLKARKTSWWEPVHVGLSRTGEPFTLDLRGGAWFLGGQPGSGKSTMALIAAAHTALDVRALLIVSNLKGSPDYAWAKPVAHRYISGAPETDRTVIPATVDLLIWLLAETGRRNDFLVRLVERGKADSTDVTPELAAKHDELRPMTVVIDEVHRLFDPADNDRAAEAVDTLAKVIKACRSVGITLACITQLAGTESVPPALTRAARVRGCLKVQDEVSWRQIFGNVGSGAYQAAGVANLARGTVILRTEDGAPTKVGCYYLRPHQLIEIGKRALRARADLELLTGEAAGEQPAPVTEAPDTAELVRDVIRAIPTAEPVGGPRDAGVAWLAGLEDVLGELDAYTGRAPGWLAPELRARKVEILDVNRRRPDDDGEQRQIKRPGVTAQAARQALARLVGVGPDTPGQP